MATKSIRVNVKEPALPLATRVRTATRAQLRCPGSKNRNHLSRSRQGPSRNEASAPTWRRQNRPGRAASLWPRPAAPSGRPTPLPRRRSPPRSRAGESGRGRRGNARSRSDRRPRGTAPASRCRRRRVPSSPCRRGDLSRPWPGAATERAGKHDPDDRYLGRTCRAWPGRGAASARIQDSIVLPPAFSGRCEEKRSASRGRQRRDCTSSPMPRLDAITAAAAVSRERSPAGAAPRRPGAAAEAARRRAPPGCAARAARPPHPTPA